MRGCSIAVETQVELPAHSTVSNDRFLFSRLVARTHTPQSACPFVA